MTEASYRAWSLATLTSTTRHALGETGYPDELGIRYIYDNTVANHGYVKAGDLILLRDRELVLGVGWVDTVEVSDVSKAQQQCPVCASTNFKARHTKKPKFLCNACKNIFDNPAEARKLIKRYTVDYSSSWRPADHLFPISGIEQFHVAHARQNSIREIRVTGIKPYIDEYVMTGPAWWNSDFRGTVSPQNGHRLALQKSRLGQQIFRELMLARFGENCAFTGPNPAPALEAAHLYQYSKTPKHDIRGGLLLRCDLHSLFDRWLVTIDPLTWTIEIAPALSRYPELASLRGRAVRVPDSLRPRLEYIQEHARRARSTWTGHGLLQG